MCGGVFFPYNKEYRDMLAERYSPEEVEEFERSGQVKSLYWQRAEPVLPVVPAAEYEDGGRTTELLPWGNRDKDAPFPQTGWARRDSIEAGKWSHLKPREVVIPVSRGVEKGKWFTIENGIRGVVVERGEERRVYMLTEDATTDFLDVTRHARMPVLVEQNTFPWLGAGE